MNRATESKYYETVLYHVVYGELIDAARNRGTTTYQAIAVIMGLETTGNKMGLEVGEMIGAISANEVAQGRPMLSAVVVNTRDVAGGGFYGWAEKLGRYNPSDYANEKDFWQKELKEVYETWKREFNQ